MAWLLEELLEIFIDSGRDIFALFIRMFLAALKPDLTMIDSYFPFARTGYAVFTFIGIGLVILLMSFDLLKVFASPGSNEEHPVRILLRGVAGIFLVVFALQICSMVMKMALVPFNAMWSAQLGVQTFDFIGWAESIQRQITELQLTGIVGLIATLILVITIGWNIVKLILEMFERYLFSAVLSYMSPVFLSTIASKGTSGILRSFGIMYFTQMLLLILNVYFIRIITSAFIALGDGFMFTTPEGTEEGGFFFWHFAILAMLKIAQNIDNHLGSMGLNVARTGQGIAGETMLAMTMLRGGGQTIGRGLSGIRRSIGGAGAAAASRVMQPIQGYREQMQAARMSGLNVNANKGDILKNAMATADGSKRQYGITTMRNGQVGATTVTQTSQATSSAPKGPYIKEQGSDGQTYYKQVDGSADYFNPQTWKNADGKGLNITDNPQDLARDFTPDQIQEAYQRGMENVPDSVTDPAEASRMAHENAAGIIGAQAHDEALLDPANEDKADMLKDSIADKVNSAFEERQGMIDPPDWEDTYKQAVGEAAAEAGLDQEGINNLTNDMWEDYKAEYDNAYDSAIGMEGVNDRDAEMFGHHAAMMEFENYADENTISQVSESAARVAEAEAASGYMHEVANQNEVFGNSLPDGAYVTPDADDMGVMHMAGYDAAGEFYSQDMYLDTAQDKPLGDYNAMTDTNGNTWNAVSNSQIPDVSQYATDGVIDYGEHGFKDVVSRFDGLESALGAPVTSIDVSSQSDGVYAVKTATGDSYMLSDRTRTSDIPSVNKLGEIRETGGPLYNISKGDDVIEREPIYKRSDSGELQPVINESTKRAEYAEVVRTKFSPYRTFARPNKPRSNTSNVFKKVTRQSTGETSDIKKSPNKNSRWEK